jgi:hypothetical protein
MIASRLRDPLNTLWNVWLLMNAIRNRKWHERIGVARLDYRN